MVKMSVTFKLSMLNCLSNLVHTFDSWEMKSSLSLMLQYKSHRNKFELIKAVQTVIQVQISKMKVKLYYLIHSIIITAKHFLFHLCQCWDEMAGTKGPYPSWDVTEMIGSVFADSAVKVLLKGESVFCVSKVKQNGYHLYLLDACIDENLASNLIFRCVQPARGVLGLFWLVGFCWWLFSMFGVLGPAPELTSGLKSWIQDIHTSMRKYEISPAPTTIFPITLRKMWHGMLVFFLSSHFVYFCFYPNQLTLFHFVSWHSRLAQNTCMCVADKETIPLPFSNLLWPHVWAHDVGQAFLESQPDPEGVKRNRAQEYRSFQRR